MISGSGQTMKLAENFTSKSRSVVCPLDYFVSTILKGTEMGNKTIVTPENINLSENTILLAFKFDGKTYSTGFELRNPHDKKCNRKRLHEIMKAMANAAFRHMEINEIR